MRANNCFQKLWLASWLLVGSATVYASEDATERLAHFAAGAEPVAFTQTKYIEGLPRPMVSRGQISLTKDRLEWVTQEPVLNRIIVTREGVYEAAGQDALPIEGSETVGQLLLALLNQDYDYLQRFFSIEPLNIQCLQLTPDREPLSSLYRIIEACGTTRLETVELVEAQGNRTAIQLHTEQE